MFFTHSFICLCATLLAQGAAVAPSGVAASGAATMMHPAAVASAPSALASAVLNGASHQPFFGTTEGTYGDDTDRHPTPARSPITTQPYPYPYPYPYPEPIVPDPYPLPAPIPGPSCPGPAPAPGPGHAPGPINGGGTSSSQVIIVFQTITSTSNKLNTALSGLTTSLQIRDVTSISQVLIQGFTTIVASLAKAVLTFPGTSPFGDSVADTVVNALIGFVRVHQALLATVIGKHSIFAQFGLTAPITAILRTLEAGVDAFAFALIRLIPSKHNAVMAQIGTLDLTLKTCVNTYNQFCFPSKKYPQTKPTCIKVQVN